MNSFGYTVPWRPSMIVTGIGTIVGAPAGGHAINLAAISAALAAAPPPHIRIPNADGSLPSPQAGRISFSLRARPPWPPW